MTFKPFLLIATPQLADPTFSRGVVLLLQHDRNGAVGVILNRPINTTLTAFATSIGIEAHPSFSGQLVYSGGPVEQNKGVILHEHDSSVEKRLIAPNLYLSASLDSFRNFLDLGIQPLRLFLGYSGWNRGQLEKEMSEGSWISSDISAPFLLHTPPETLWENVLKHMGVDPYLLASGSGVH